MSDFKSSTPAITPTNCRLHTELGSSKDYIFSLLFFFFFFFFFSSFAVWRINSTTYRLHFWYQSVPLIKSEHLLTPQFQELLSKATKDIAVYTSELYEPYFLCYFVMIIVHAWSYTKLPSGEKDNNWQIERNCLLHCLYRLLPLLTIVLNNQQRKMCSNMASLQVSKLESCMPWLQCCYSYTEKLYTSKSYHFAHYGYLKLIITYHDDTCKLIRMINMQFWHFLRIKIKKKYTQTSIKVKKKVGIAVKEGLFEWKINTRRHP